MLSKVKQTITKYKMLRYGDKVIVGVSGGADSTALLYILNALKKEHNLILYIVHINYHLRGADSDADEKFVRKLGSKLCVPVFVVNADVKGSIQEAARDLRYKAFLKVAKEVGAGKIAVAHNKDDQAETVVMRLLRGTGITGLKGIPETRELDQKTIIRPFINVSRQEIEKYLKAIKMRFRTDKSNLKPKYLRNKIRLKLIPLIEKEYSPNFKENVLKLTEILSVEDDFLTAETEKLFKKFSVFNIDGIALKYKKFHPALSFRLVRRAVKEVKGSLDGIEYKHIEAVSKVFSGEVKKTELPGGIVAEKVKNGILIRKKSKVVSSKAVLKIDKATKFGRYEFKTEVKSKVLNFNGLENAFMDYEKLSLPLSIRTRKPADRFMPFGMKGTKKLQDFFVDEKVPEYKRDEIPIFTDRKGRIVWVAGLRLDERVRVGAKTKKILHLSLKYR